MIKKEFRKVIKQLESATSHEEYIEIYANAMSFFWIHGISYVEFVYTLEMAGLKVLYDYRDKKEFLLDLEHEYNINKKKNNEDENRRAIRIKEIRESLNKLRLAKNSKQLMKFLEEERRRLSDLGIDPRELIDAMADAGIVIPAISSEIIFNDENTNGI